MLAPTRAPAARRPALRHPHATRAPGNRTPRRRWRRIATLASLLCLAPALVSYVSMLTKPSDSSLSIRSVEWLRDNGARGLVNRIESIYYSLNAPATGGPALRALLKQPGAGPGLAVAARA